MLLQTRSCVPSGAATTHADRESISELNVPMRRASLVQAANSERTEVPICTRRPTPRGDVRCARSVRVAWVQIGRYGRARSRRAGMSD